ncbi:MAG: ABC transporter ATP-binding protein [Megasphaera sp.]|jgi:spermidine/putrescine transport system ATP-binding protein|uniref:ABC transporter ATP-binding protein n=1 Tax=Megasphaera sueciensis TaxID=349094 RepID=UPI003CFE403D|nr:ABC transporter ATP-binding protein [Megasphaera sp.]
MDEILKVEKLVKSFGNVKVLKDINLSVGKGEFISLLGPSGCGKTTMLRILAGLETPTSGRVLVNGQDMKGIPPYKRYNGMVFQNYALFPHMTVEQNIIFGLTMHHMDKTKIKTMVKDAIGLTHLENLEKRYPREMSGGQQQRVALARALVLQPNLLLLDEPLSNLDAKLRKEMQIEIRNIQKKLHVTTVFVTHDQEEALVMSDRIAVMNKGVIEQFGVPNDLYEKPETKFVANFIGTANILEGKLVEVMDDSMAVVLLGDDAVKIQNRQHIKPGENAMFSLRPERVMLREDGSTFSTEKQNIQQCRIINKNYLGKSTKFQVELKNGVVISVERPADSSAISLSPGDEAFIGWKATDGLGIYDTALQA